MLTCPEPGKLKMEAKPVGYRRKPQGAIEAVRLLAPFVAAEADTTASRLFGAGDGILHEQPAKAAAAVPAIDDEVLHQCPGAGAMGEVGHDEKYHSAHNIAPMFGNEKLMPRGGADLVEHLSIIIQGRALAQFNLRGSNSQLAVKLKDTRNILLGSQSNCRHIRRDLLGRWD